MLLDLKEIGVQAINIISTRKFQITYAKFLSILGCNSPRTVNESGGYVTEKSLGQGNNKWGSKWQQIL